MPVLNHGQDKKTKFPYHQKQWHNSKDQQAAQRKARKKGGGLGLLTECQGEASYLDVGVKSQF